MEHGMDDDEPMSGQDVEITPENVSKYVEKATEFWFKTGIEYQIQ